MRLEGKVAVLTGAVGGIGSAIVEKFVAEGAKVVAADLNSEALQQLEAKYGDSVKGIVTDVSDYQQVARMVDTAVETFGTLDIVMNNAGIGALKRLIDHDPAEDFDFAIKVNQNGVYYGILAAAKKFEALGKPGVIINTSSIYGTMTAEMSFSYNTSKAAVDMMTKSAALELAPLNIRVVAMAPGRCDTPLLREYEKVGLWEHIKKEQMRGLTQPYEIANVFAFLASEESNCINGCTVYGDDGFLQFKFPLEPKM
ncbi:MAG: SDR family oxidoreductase [Xanthomonadales bacterium]|nr:SDR family oxidoreductase [Xanthomonadales bacterium]